MVSSFLPRRRVPGCSTFFNGTNKKKEESLTSDLEDSYATHSLGSNKTAEQMQEDNSFVVRQKEHLTIRKTKYCQLPSNT